MQKIRLNRRQQAQLASLFREFWADSLEYCDEHLDYINRRHQQFLNLQRG